MFLARLLFLILFTSLSVFTLGQSEHTVLTEQAKASVYSEPQKTAEVAQYLITSAKSAEEKAGAHYLLALANYATGTYSESLTSAFDARAAAAALKNDSLFELSTELIVEILHFLQLHRQAIHYVGDLDVERAEFYSMLYEQEIDSLQTGLRPLKNERTSKTIRNPQYRLKLFLALGEQYLLNGQADSALYYARQTYILSESMGSYWSAKSALAVGKSLFYLHKNEKATHSFSEALELATKLDNPFLALEIQRMMATNYLALHNLPGFHRHNQEALNLHNQADHAQTEAANTAYELLSHEKQQELAQAKQTFQISAGIAGILFLALCLVRFIQWMYQRRTLGMYRTFLEFLRKQKEAVPAVDVAASNITVSKPAILKDSEEAILLALQKFESSALYTRKEMSLGMLAAKLNTNTKYLSQVINQHKEKNYSSYINELRIKYITGKIDSDPHYLNYKVSYLAEEAGFSSHSAFTTVFKSVVGLSPIAYIDFIKRRKEGVL